MLTDERIKRAIVRLESTREGQLAKEEVDEGMPLREVFHSYDLDFQQIEDLRVIHRAVRERR